MMKLGLLKLNTRSYVLIHTQAQISEKMQMGLLFLEDRALTLALDNFDEVRKAAFELHLWDLWAQTLLYLAEIHFRSSENNLIKTNIYLCHLLIRTNCSETMCLYFYTELGKLCLKYTEFELAENLAYHALSESGRANNQLFDVEARLILAKVLIERREYDAASVHLRFCFQSVDQMDMKDITLRTYERSIEASWYQGKYSEILPIIDKALILATALNSNSALLKLRIKQTAILRVLGDHDNLTAVEKEIESLFADKCLDFGSARQLSARQAEEFADFCLILGWFFICAGELKKAIIPLYLNRIERRNESSDILLLDSWLALSTVHLSRGKPSTAVNYLWRCVLALQDKLFYHQRLLVSILNQLSTAYGQIGKLQLSAQIQSLFSRIVHQANEYTDSTIPGRIIWTHLSSILQDIMSKEGIVEPLTFKVAGIRVDLNDGAITVNDIEQKDKLEGKYLHIFKRFVSAHNNALEKLHILNVYDPFALQYDIRDVDSRLRTIIHRINRLFPTIIIKSHRGKGIYYLDRNL